MMSIVVLGEEKLYLNGIRNLFKMCSGESLCLFDQNSMFDNCIVLILHYNDNQYIVLTTFIRNGVNSIPELELMVKSRIGIDYLKKN